jgi:hypothetical protein
LSPEEREAFRKRASENPKEFKKLGVNLLWVLEQISNLDRPVIMAALFLGFLKGAVTSQELREAVGRSIQRVYRRSSASCSVSGEINDLPGGIREL